MSLIMLSGETPAAPSGSANGMWQLGPEDSSGVRRASVSFGAPTTSAPGLVPALKSTNADKYRLGASGLWVEDHGIPSGGATGQVLTKNSAADYDAAWATPSSSSGGGRLIAEVIADGSSATVTFASIPQTYRNLVLRYTARATAATTSLELYMRCNGDAGSNYVRQYLYGAAGSVAANGAYNIANPGIASIAAANAPTSCASSGVVTIFDYSRTAFAKNAQSLGFNFFDASNSIAITYGVTWRSTAAINAITLGVSSGNIASGSVFTLYGDL